jgi:hypothetical protein
MQDVPDVQVTPDSWVPVPGTPDGVHVVPFQVSEKDVTVASLCSPVPTATQPDLDTHDTPDSVAVVSPAGMGTASGDQRTPFHRSASGTFCPGLALSWAYPTAMHQVADRQETPLRVVIASRGTLSSTQLVPFQ